MHRHISSLAWQAECENLQPRRIHVECIYQYVCVNITAKTSSLLMGYDYYIGEDWSWHLIVWKKMNGHLISVYYYVRENNYYKCNRIKLSNIDHIKQNGIWIIDSFVN